MKICTLEACLLLNTFSSCQKNQEPSCRMNVFSRKRVKIQNAHMQFMHKDCTLAVCICFGFVCVHAALTLSMPVQYTCSTYNVYKCVPL